jgi:hypothetical protein
MEYVYQQQARPANATGVTVSLIALDPNGNYINIGQATSDSNGMYAISYTPNVPGIYKIYASFDGSNSYWPSSAESAISVVNTATTAPTQAPQQASVADLYFLPMSIAIIIAIAVVAALVVYSITRKHP